jgi:galactitol-specific phosphotransferase system IIC component
MAILENGLKGNILTGLAIGIGAAVLAPVVIPIIASVAKPLAKAAIKGGIQMYERGKEAIAEVSEVVEDMVAEAKSELAQPATAAGAIAAEQGASEQS